MVAIAIGLLLMLVMTRLMAQQDSARAEIEKAGRQIEDGRYAVNLLHEDVQLAGYLRPDRGDRHGAGGAAQSLRDRQHTAAGLLAIGEALALPIQGYDSPTTVPAGLADCIEDEDHLDGTDVLVVRRTDAEADGVVPATTVDDRVYVQTTPIERIVGLGGSTAAATFTLLRKTPPARRSCAAMSSASTSSAPAMCRPADRRAATPMAMPRDGHEAHALEQRAHGGGIGRRVLDELEAVGAHRVVPGGELHVPPHVSSDRKRAL